MKTGTLIELNVKPGDMVEWNGSEYVAFEEPKPGDASGVWAGTEGHGWISGNATVRIISRADDAPTLWSEMTDAEKGALLLAQHNGEKIEFLTDGEWWYIERPNWKPSYAYRVRTHPKVETVALCYRQDVGQVKNRIGAIDLINGKPDPASIKMEELQWNSI